MENGRSPGNDRLTRCFLWTNVSDCIYQSLLAAKKKGFLSVSQRQAVIKLIEKKDRDKRYIKNWRPIS